MSNDYPNSNLEEVRKDIIICHLQKEIEKLKTSNSLYQDKINESMSKVEEQLNIPILENSEDENLDIFDRILRVGSNIKSLHNQILDQIIDILKHGDKDSNYVQEILIDIKEKLKDTINVPTKDMTKQNTIQNIHQTAFSYQPEPEKLQKALIESLTIHQDSETKIKYLQGRIMDLELQINFYLENNTNSNNNKPSPEVETETKNKEREYSLTKKYTYLCKKYKDLDAKYKKLQISSSKEKSELIQNRQKFQSEIDRLKVTIDNQNIEIKDIKNKLEKSDLDLVKFKKAYFVQKNKYDKLFESLKRKPLKVIDTERMKKLKVIKLIGQGYESKIIKVTDEQTMALKEFQETNESKRKELIEKLKKIQFDFEIINGLQHPNIIKSFGFFLGDGDHKPSILLEFYPFNLSNVVKKMQDFERVTTIFEISATLKALHKAKIIHKNLKPENILIDDTKHIKITDIGFFDSKSDDFCTQKFMAPELLNRCPTCNEKIDVYSFGVLMFFILTKGHYPNITIDDARNGQKSQIPNNVNDFSRNLINKCWATNAGERPSFSEIVDMIKKCNFGLIDGLEQKVSDIKKFLSI